MRNFQNLGIGETSKSFHQSKLSNLVVHAGHSQQLELLKAIMQSQQARKGLKLFYSQKNNF